MMTTFVEIKLVVAVAGSGQIGFGGDPAQQNSKSCTKLNRRNNA
jgi:hypothetical protein